MGIVPSIVAANRNKREYGEDANEWKPERQLDESTPNHVTFGLGPRSCIGRRAALAILRQWTAAIVTNFKITRVDNKNVVIAQGNGSIRVTHPSPTLSLQ